MTAAQPVVSVVGLEKAYGPVRALRGIDVTVDRGEVFALLGPNGAGKTTAVEILEGYRTADAGEVGVLGVDPARAGPAHRDRIGIVLQQSGIERELTVREILVRLARVYSRPADPDEMVRLVGLEESADRRIKVLSGGQRRRVDLAAALIGNPELVFLDEPTTGFDPEARREAWGIVQRLTRGGVTVILTTHYLDEAQQLADRVAVIADGRIVAEGDPRTLGGRESAAARISFRLPTGSGEPPLAHGPPGPDGWHVIVTEDPVGDLHALTGWSIENGIDLGGLEVHRPTLEDVYLELVGVDVSAGRER